MIVYVYLSKSCSVRSARGFWKRVVYYNSINYRNLLYSVSVTYHSEEYWLLIKRLKNSCGNVLLGFFFFKFDWLMNGRSVTQKLSLNPSEINIHSGWNWCFLYNVQPNEQSQLHSISLLIGKVQYVVMSYAGESEMVNVQIFIGVNYRPLLWKEISTSQECKGIIHEIKCYNRLKIPFGSHTDTNGWIKQGVARYRISQQHAERKRENLISHNPPG